MIRLEGLADSGARGLSTPSARSRALVRRPAVDVPGERKLRCSNPTSLPQRLALLFLVMLLGTWGITVIGTLFSAMTVNLRLRELMLPVLLYPLMIPLLIGAMEMTSGLLNGNAVISDIRLLIVYDVMFTSLALYLIEFILVI